MSLYDEYGVNYLRKSSSVSSKRSESVYAKDLDHELLADYEEEQLLREAQAGDEFARERLILCNLRLVRSIVQRYAKPEMGITVDDLMADGVVGLCRAISGYDESFGTRLSTYATLWIHQAVARSHFLHNVIRLPEYVCQEMRVINKAESTLIREHRTPSVEALSEITGIKLEKVERLKHLESDVMYVMSLDEQVGEEKDAPTGIDIVVDENAQNAYYQVELEADLDFFLSKLDTNERFIVERSYGIPIEMTNSEIGEILGYSRHSIRNKLEKAMVKLRRLGSALRGSVEEQIEAMENPIKVMTGEQEIIPLFNAADLPMKKREFIRQKRRNKTDEPDKNINQLSLLEYLDKQNQQP
ncbi:MAG: sigma-70 family RNA polymerase sigma factor [Candidatus Poribacteria bacterium]|nr:sigma-70 family RNA polymerase sigma factor [Candidatus Poribacteria bacterium]